MKVLIVHNYYQIPGGEDAVVKNEYDLLKENGNTVYLYTRHNKEISTANILKKIFFLFSSAFSLKTFSDIKKMIKNKKIDIVHVHNTLTLISPSVYYAAAACGVPVVQTVHNFRLLCPSATLYRNGRICEACKKSLVNAVRYKCYRNSMLQSLTSALILKLHRTLGIYKKINYICLTEFNKNKLLELNRKNNIIIDEAKIYVKPNFSEMQQQIIPFENRKNQVIFAGRLDRLKGIRILLDAWTGINTYELIICGSGSEEGYVKEFIEQHPKANIKYIGYMEHNGLMKKIAESKALILPTQWYEGFPMNIVESFACATPVLGSKIGNVGNLIEDGVTGYTFDETDLEDIRNRVLKISAALSEGALKKYQKYYTKDINYKQLQEIYRQIIKRENKLSL